MFNFNKKNRRFSVTCTEKNESKVRSTLKACGLKVDVVVFDVDSDLRTLMGQWTPKHGDERTREAIEFSPCRNVCVC